MPDYRYEKLEAWSKFALRGEFDPSEDPERTFRAGWDALFEALGGDKHFIDIRVDEQWDHTVWTIQHPVTERLEGTLFECPFTVAGPDVSRAIVASEGPGRYRIWKEASALLWEKVT